MVKQLKKLPFLLDGGFIKNIYADFQIDINFLNEDIAKIVNRLVFFVHPLLTYSFFIPEESCNDDISIHVRNISNICEGVNMKVITHFSIRIELLHEIQKMVQYFTI